MVSAVGNARCASLRLSCAVILCVTQLCVTSMYATVRLTITDVDGAKMEYAGAGQSFRVLVETDARVVNSRPTIEGLSAFLCGETSFREINTPTTKLSRFGYLARIDESGQYTIGPARIQVDGHEEASAALELEVKQEAKTSGAMGEKMQYKPFARLSVSRQDVFVHEPVVCTLRFYYASTQVRTVSRQMEDAEDFVVIDRVTPVQGSETIDGKSWNFVEWSWRLYSKKSGSLMLPACAVHFEEVQSGGIFFMNMQSKQVYSNAVAFEVKELPLSDEPIQAVGSFERFEARVDPTVACAGDALVLTLRVEGSGLFDDEQPVSVQGMPEALKWYESKQNDLDLERDGVTGKVFEFIVQGLREGEWQIPEQRFSYFDTKAQQCRTLISTPISITLLPGQALVGMVPTVPHMPTSFANGLLHDDLAPRITGDGLSWWAREQRALPWWVMLLLIIFPSLLVAVALIRRRLLHTPLVRKKTIFSSAREELMLVTRRGEVQELYALFTRLFVRLYDDPTVDLLSENLHTRLRDAGLKSETLERWQQFVDRCAECAFYTIDSESMSKESLLVVAEQWLLFFKERL
jgi:hypothetical protein